MRMTGSGAYGTYYYIGNGKGMKVTSWGYATKKEALASKAFKKAKKEANLLKKLEKTGFTPKCYGVQAKKWDNGWQVCIVMEHLGRKTLYNTDYPGWQIIAIREGLQDKLRAFGYYHRDLHADNIMVYKKKFYAIDFDPSFVKKVA